MVTTSEPQRTETSLSLMSNILAGLYFLICILTLLVGVGACCLAGYYHFFPIQPHSFGLGDGGVFETLLVYGSLMVILSFMGLLFIVEESSCLGRLYEVLSIVTVMASIFGGAIFWVAKANSLSRLKNSWDSADRITKGKLELQLACCGFSKGISINECAVSNPKEFCGDVIHDTQYPILIAQITISFAGIALLFMTYLISGHLRRKYRLVNQNLDIERRERRTKQKHDRHINDEGRENPNSPNHDSPSTSADNHKTAGLKGITALPESFRQLAEKKSPISLRNKNPLESDRLARN